jgi:hypothetical protein
LSTKKGGRRGGVMSLRLIQDDPDLELKKDSLFFKLYTSYSQAFYLALKFSADPLPKPNKKAANLRSYLSSRVYIFRDTSVILGTSLWGRHLTVEEKENILCKRNCIRFYVKTKVTSPVVQKLVIFKNGVVSLSFPTIDYGFVDYLFYKRSAKFFDSDSEEMISLSSKIEERQKQDLAGLVCFDAQGGLANDGKFIHVPFAFFLTERLTLEPSSI